MSENKEEKIIVYESIKHNKYICSLKMCLICFSDSLN